MTHDFDEVGVLVIPIEWCMFLDLSESLPLVIALRINLRQILKETILSASCTHWSNASPRIVRSLPPVSQGALSIFNGGCIQIPRLTRVLLCRMEAPFSSIGLHHCNREDTKFIVSSGVGQRSQILCVIQCLLWEKNER